MICFPNAKINLGLRVIEKRADGFHNIETVFYPIGWKDVLEVVENKTTTDVFRLTVSGLDIQGKIEDNLLYKAYSFMRQKKQLPNIDVFLHKVLPMGAGLGGGSSDAAFFINLLNLQFNLGFSEEERLLMAQSLGSDCAFFIKNTPMYATNKGDSLSPISINLKDMFAVVLFPNIHSNTKEAYSYIKPQASIKPIPDILKQPIHTWKEELVNDFEQSIFKLYPKLKSIKDKLYNEGAIYASMSGSGSAVFGLFKDKPVLTCFKDYPQWCGTL